MTTDQRHNALFRERDRILAIPGKLLRLLVPSEKDRLRDIRDELSLAAA